MRKLGVLIAVAAAAVACGEARETADAAGDQMQTFSEAAGELADDVSGDSADVSAAADEMAEAEQDATDAAKKEAADADDAAEEGIRTE